MSDEQPKLSPEWTPAPESEAACAATGCGCPLGRASVIVKGALLAVVLFLGGSLAAMAMFPEVAVYADPVIGEGTYLGTVLFGDTKSACSVNAAATAGGGSCCPLSGSTTVVAGSSCCTTGGEGEALLVTNGSEAASRGAAEGGSLRKLGSALLAGAVAAMGEDLSSAGEASEARSEEAPSETSAAADRSE